MDKRKGRANGNRALIDAIAEDPLVHEKALVCLLLDKVAYLMHGVECMRMARDSYGPVLKARAIVTTKPVVRICGPAVTTPRKQARL